jgi:AcrR family transcriptional regulator
MHDIESGTVAAGSDSLPWRGDPLPRGRHKLSAEEVRASQRARILRAMLELVAERGYGPTSVPDVVAAARVSRSGFYALFEDKAECFLAVIDELAGELLRGLFDLRGIDDWDAAVERGVDIYLSFWREQPLFARAYLVELPAAGEDAVAHRERQLMRFEVLFDALAAWARERDPSLPQVNRLASRLLVGGITEIVAREVRAGRTAALGSLREELVALVRGIIA